MTFFQRLKNSLRSNVNALLDHVEDPQKIHELTISDLRTHEKEGRRKLIEMMAQFKGLETTIARDESKRKELEPTLTALSSEIESFKQFLDSIPLKIAKLNAQRSAQAAENIKTKTPPFETFDRMEEKIQDSENYSDAVKELDTSVISEPKLLATPSPGSADQIEKIEAELEALKKKLRR